MAVTRNILPPVLAISLFLTSLLWTVLTVIFVIVGWTAPPLEHRHGVLLLVGLMMAVVGAAGMLVGLSDAARRRRERVSQREISHDDVGM